MPRIEIKKRKQTERDFMTPIDPTPEEKDRDKRFREAREKHKKGKFLSGGSGKKAVNTFDKNSNQPQLLRDKEGRIHGVHLPDGRQFVGIDPKLAREIIANFNKSQLGEAQFNETPEQQQVQQGQQALEQLPQVATDLFNTEAGVNNQQTPFQSLQGEPITQEELNPQPTLGQAAFRGGGGLLAQELGILPKPEKFKVNGKTVDLRQAMLDGNIEEFHTKVDPVSQAIGNAVLLGFKLPLLNTIPSLFTTRASNLQQSINTNGEEASRLAQKAIAGKANPVETLKQLDRLEQDMLEMEASIKTGMISQIILNNSGDIHDINNDIQEKLSELESNRLEIQNRMLQNAFPELTPEEIQFEVERLIEEGLIERVDLAVTSRPNSGQSSISQNNQDSFGSRLGKAAFSDVPFIGNEENSPFAGKDVQADTLPIGLAGGAGKLSKIPGWTDDLVEDIPRVVERAGNLKLNRLTKYLKDNQDKLDEVGSFTDKGLKLLEEVLSKGLPK